MLKGFRKWRYISFLLSFAMVLEAAAPFGAVSAIAAETDTVQETVQEDVQPSSDEGEGSDEWLNSYGNVNAGEEELSPDEYDERGPLSAFTFDDDGEEMDAADEDVVSDEALEATNSEGDIGVKFGNNIIRVHSTLYNAMFRDFYYASEFILYSDFFVGQELPVNQRKVTIYLNGHHLKTDGVNRLIKVGKTASVTIDGFAPDQKTNKPTIRYFESKSDGGAFYLEDQSELVLKNVDVMQCKAKNGGVVSMQKQASLKLYNTRFDGNTAKKRGGAIYINGTKSNISMDSDSQLRWNSAGTHGGAIYVNSSRAGIYGGARRTLIEHNSCNENGGGIYVDGSNAARNAGDAIIRNLTFDKNKAPKGSGGAVYINCGGCSFSGIKATDNEAKDLGGAICVIGSSKPMDRDTSFSDLQLTGNKVTASKKAYGGGLYAASTQNVNLSGLVIVKDNKASNYTNNIYLWDTDILGAGEHAYLELGSLAAQSDIGVLRSKPSFGQVTQKPVFVDLKCIHYDDNGWHLELSTKVGKEYLLIKPGPPAAAPKPTETKLDLSYKTKGTVEGTYTTADGAQYDRIVGYASSPSHTNEKIDLVNKYFFSDGYFMDDPDKYNIHLATMGMNVAMASADSNMKGHSDYRYKFDNIKSLYQGIGCKEEDIYINDWYIEKPTDDSIGVAIAKKKIHDKKNNKDYYLVPIAIRSYGYEKEWASNMTLNGKNTAGENNAESSGFRSARTHVVDSLEYFIDHYGLRSEIEQGNVKFWLNGFSRGSATANLTGKYLVDTYGKYSAKYKNKPNQVFAYCYAVPAGGTDTAEAPEAKTDNRAGYYCIHNIINKVDLTPMVAPEMMGFKRYGVDHYVPGDKDAGNVKSEEKHATADNGSYAYTLMYDNKEFITGSGAYNGIRQNMLDQLLGVNEEVNFSDRFKVADFSLLSSPHFKPAKEKAQMTIERWLPDMYTKVQTWDTLGKDKKLTRSNYSDYQIKPGKSDGKWSKGISAQDAFRGLVMLMLSKTPSEKAALSTALGSVTNKLAAIASTESGPSILTIYNKLITGKDWQDADKQQKWLDFFWGKLTDNSYGQPSIKDKSVMSDEELKSFESYFPALMELVFRLLPKDKTDNDFHLVSSFAYNTETILQGHVPEIYLAWLRQYDDYYNNEAKKSYKFTSGGSNPTVPTANLESGKTYQGTQTLKLSAPGCEIYYTIKKDSGKESPLKLYRSGEGITLTANPNADVAYTVKYYSIRDMIKGSERTCSDSSSTTATYTIRGKRTVQFKNKPNQAEYSTARYAEGEKVKISSASDDNYSIDYWTVSNDPSKKYEGDSVEFVMPDSDVIVEAHFIPTIVKVSNIQLTSVPQLNQPGPCIGAISSIELEASDGSKVYYPYVSNLRPKWATLTKTPRSGAFSWYNMRFVRNLTGDEWMFIALKSSFETQDGKKYRFSKAINNYHGGDASICATYFNDDTIKLLHRSTIAKPVVQRIDVPVGRQYPYCATAEELDDFLRYEEVNLNFGVDEMNVIEGVNWDKSSYVPKDEGGIYNFTGTLKNADKYDLSKVGGSSVSISVKVNAKISSPVPAADLTSGEYIKEEGPDKDKFEDNNLKVTVRVKDYQGISGNIYYKAVEYADGQVPTEAPEISEMTECGSDGKILLEGTENQTRKYKLWLRGYNESASTPASEAVSYTYSVYIPKYRNVNVEIWDVNDTSKALYTAEAEEAIVGDPVIYYADEELETAGEEGLSDEYTGAYWTSSVSADKVVGPEFYLEKMPDEDVTLKLFAAKKIDYIVIYPDEDVTPETGVDLYAEADETRIMLGGKEYTLSGNQVGLVFNPDDEIAMGSTTYTISGNLSFKDMKGEDDDGNLVSLGGRYSLSENMVVEIVSPFEDDKIQAVVDAEEDDDGLYEELEFSHTFDMTEEATITDVYGPEDITIPWVEGADRSYDKLIKPVLLEEAGEVHVITDDGSLSSLPVEWGLPKEPGYDETSVRPQNLTITGTVEVPEGYQAYDLDDSTIEVEEYEVEVFVSVEGAPSVTMPKPDPDGAAVECRDVSGNMIGSIDVAMSCDTVSADIYYTLDGTDPFDEKGNPAPQAEKYVSGNFVTIEGKPDDEVTLKMAAVKSNMQPSEIYTTFFEFTRPEAEVPEIDLEDIYNLALMRGQKLSDLTLPEGWDWDTDYMDDPTTTPEDDEYDVGDIVDASVYYNPDPDKYEDVLFDLEIPILEKEYEIATEAGSCMAYMMVSADEIPEGAESEYTPYENGYYLTRVETAPEDETIVIIFNKEIEDKKEYTSLIKKTASGKELALTKEPKEYGSETLCAEFTMPAEDVIISPVYEKKGEYTVEGLTVDKQSVSMDLYDKTELNVTVTYSASGKGDKPKPELVDNSGLLEQVGDAVADGGKYKFTLQAVKPGQGTLWVKCKDKSQPVPVNINLGRQRQVNVTNGIVTKIDGKALEGSRTSCYVEAGKTVTLKATPPSSLYIFDGWTLKGANVDEETLSQNEITFTVNESVDAEAAFTEDPEYKKEEESKDKDVKVKSLTLKPADGSKGSIVFDLTGKTSAELEKDLIATAKYYDGAQPEITFHSSNTDVVGVKRIGTSKTGTVSANIGATGKAGEAVITAYCGNKSASIKVSVADKASGVRIFLESVETDYHNMLVGEQAAFTAEAYPLTSTDQITSVSWKVVKDKANKNVISVKKGLVTAKKAGTAKLQVIIKVKPAGAKKAVTLPAGECTITVKSTENDKPKNKQNDKSYKLALSKSSLKIDRTTAPEKELTIKLTPKKPLTVDQLISGISVNGITAETTNYDVVDVAEEDIVLAKDSKGKTAQAKLKIRAEGPGTAYIMVKSKLGESQENLAVCKITVTTPVKEIKLTGDSQALFPGEVDFPGAIESTADADAIRIKQGSYDRLYYEVDPSDTTDIGKISWSAKGGVTVKNGVIYAKSISKTDKKTGKIKPAEVTLKCGKIKHTIKVIVQ